MRKGVREGARETRAGQSARRRWLWATATKSWSEPRGSARER